MKHQELVNYYYKVTTAIDQVNAVDTVEPANETDE